MFFGTSHRGEMYSCGLGMYHCTSAPLGVGDILYSGYDSITRRILTGRMDQDDVEPHEVAHFLARKETERFFESFRLSHHLDSLPSRGDCVFACWREEHLGRWSGRPHKYRLEIVKMTKCFAADAGWFNILLKKLEVGEDPGPEVANCLARLYWSGIRCEDVDSNPEDCGLKPHYELLIQGKLRVVGALA